MTGIKNSHYNQGGLLFYLTIYAYKHILHPVRASPKSIIYLISYIINYSRNTQPKIKYRG